MTSSSIGNNNHKGTIKPNEAMASRLGRKPEAIRKRTVMRYNVASANVGQNDTR